MNRIKFIIVVLFLFSILCGVQSISITAKANDEINLNSYELVDSILATTEENEKKSWHGSTNCYYYAIDRYNIMHETTGINDYTYAHNPGFIRYGNIIDVTTMQNLLNNVEADLETLHCENITVSTTKPTYINGYHLICVRMGENEIKKDYHFMKYNPVDGYWYHKPSTESAVLRYNYEPMNNRIWTDERTRMMQFVPPTITYDSEIYYMMYKPTLKLNTKDGGYAIGSYEDFGYIEQYGIKNEKGNSWSLTNSFTIPSTVKWQPIKEVGNLTIKGNGYSISGLRMEVLSESIGQDDSDGQNIGFIGKTQGNVIINNLIFDNVEMRINGNIDFGKRLNIGVIAAVNNGQILNCKVGNLRIYGEVNISSNVSADIGGLCGVNNGTLSECQVNYCGMSGFGNLGGIAGKNTSNISNCAVNNSSISLYYGTAGGIVGKNESVLAGCEVNNTNISCYNGYPSDLPQYYPSEHNAYIGGICGWNEGGTIDNNSVSYSEIKYAGGQTDSHSFAPAMRLLCGRSANSSVSGTITETSVNKGNLRTITWKGGFLNLVTYSHNQAQYAGNAEIGRVAT